MLLVLRTCNKTNATSLKALEVKVVKVEEDCCSLPASSQVSIKVTRNKHY